MVPVTLSPLICAFVNSGAVKTASASSVIEAGIASFSQSALVIGVRGQLTTPWPNPGIGASLRWGMWS